jgi:hypothetical protein
MVALNYKTRIDEDMPIILTGMTVEDAEKQNRQEGVFCYICRRYEDQESLAIDWQGDEEVVRTPELEMLELDVEMHGIGFRFYLCHECHILVQGISQMTLKQKDKEEDVDS